MENEWVEFSFLLFQTLAHDTAVCFTSIFSRGDNRNILLQGLINFKVGNIGTAMSEIKLTDKWAASKCTQVSAIVASNCSLCLKMP